MINETHTILGAMPITFKTVAGEREYKVMKGVYGYLIQSKNGNLFTPGQWKQLARS